MLLSYSPSETEELVCDLYQLHGIKHAAQLDLDLIASIWDAEIWQYPFPSQSIWESGENIICLNTLSDPRQRRAEFFHELGHIARHVGSQAGLHQLFIELQEWQADRFQLVAAMPYYLLPDPVRTWEQYVAVLAETFRVPYTVAQRRVHSIQARIDPYHF
ncbi:hypothetical protein B9G55_01255 [Saccharibacillus sp. O16]|nr:hypothetical protein B9G55_01255 [Saccharibacillus sp. O16]